MRSYENNIASKSDYYAYTPSKTAKNLFFYPLYTGYFHYMAGYHLKRDYYDSFLIMLITKGTCSLTIDNVTFDVSEGQLAFINCYSSHEYNCLEGCEALWLHFDGPLAQKYYEHISGSFGNVVVPRNVQVVKHTLSKIYNKFKDSEPIKEASISNYITQILTEFLLSEGSPYSSSSTSKNLEASITYINEHFHEQIPLATLAEKAALSPFYFSRIFLKETGVTPHQYIIATRLNFAKFLLKTTTFPIKKVAFSSGFTSESNFCFTFKRRENVTPSQYRFADAIKE